MTSAAKVLAREFAAASDLIMQKVHFLDDESISVTTNSGDYTMRIGSDDDRFLFVGPGGNVISFAFPDDWWD